MSGGVQQTGGPPSDVPQPSAPANNPNGALIPDILSIIQRQSTENLEPLSSNRVAIGSKLAEVSRTTLLGQNALGSATNPPPLPKAVSQHITVGLPEADGSQRTVSISQLMRELNIPGLSIAVIDRGALVAAENFGELANSDRLSQCASTTKTITALTALRLIDRNVHYHGKPVHLDSDVSSLLPPTLWAQLDPQGLAVGDHALTIRQLLSLQGGFTILQHIIEELSGKPFADAVQEQILEPLDMRDSTFTPEKERTVDGHKISGDSVRQHPEQTAAELWSNARDMAKPLIALQDSLAGRHGAPLSREMAQEMISRQKEGDPPTGLGCEIETVGPSTFFMHAGTNPGFRTVIVGSDTGQGAVVMANSDSGEVAYNDIIHTIAQVYGWPVAADGHHPMFPPPLTTEEVAELAEQGGPIDPQSWGRPLAGSYIFTEDDGTEHQIVIQSDRQGKPHLLVENEKPVELAPLTPHVATFQPEIPGPKFLLRVSTSEDGRAILNLFGAEHKPST